MQTITAAARNNISQLLSRPVVANKLIKPSSSEFASAIENVSIDNAVNAFVKLPSLTQFADKLFDEMACQGLPESFRNAVLSEQGETIRNMLGIIYKDAEPQDEVIFNKVFKEVTREGNNFEKEKKLSSELSFLFSKYGPDALEKHKSDYIQHCREAWKYHHSGFDKDTKDEDIFSPDVMACCNVLIKRIDILSKPNQTWSSIHASGVCFKNTCAALSKTLRFHDAQPSPELVGRSTSPNSAPLTPEAYQPEMTNTAHPEISIPAGNGHGPITIHNTVHGGNGTSTVSGSPANTHPASVADFGIALLNTPNEQLGNDKARLVEKFMDLYLGRAQNGGQDKFSDYVDSVVQGGASELVPSELLLPPAVVAMSERQVAVSEPLISIETDSLPQQAISRLETIHQPQKIATFEDNINVRQSNYSASLAPTDTGKTLQHAATQVAQALSGLLDETDSAIRSENKLHNTSSVLKNDASPELKSNLQSTNLASIEPIKNVTNVNSRVQQLVNKFEALNTETQMRHDSTINRNTFGMEASTNRSQQSSNTQTLGFQPLRFSSDKFKFDVNSHQRTIYTTNRTIDPFSRHSADLKHLSNLVHQKSEGKVDDIELNGEVVSNL